MYNSDVVNLDQISFNTGDKKRSISPHVYLISPGFSITQLFLLGLGFQYPGNFFLASECIVKDDKEAKDMGSYSKGDISKPLDLNEKIDGKIPNVCRMNYFNNMLKKSADDLYKDHGDQNDQEGKYKMLIDELYDRNPNLVESLEKLMKVISYGRNINFRCLDFNNSNNFITEVLTSEIRNLFHPPILFYSKIGISNPEFFANLPMKARIKKKYFKDDKKNQMGYNPYFQIQFIVGSKGGIPTLLLLNDKCSINILDNSSSISASSQEIWENIDNIYMIYYSIDEDINPEQTLYKKEIKKKDSGFHLSINRETDEILEKHIKYKYDKFWKERNSNLIQLIKESIQYPAFFGFCSNYSERVCYYGSVMLSYDPTSANKILEQISHSEERTTSISFYNCYNTYTTFVLKLFEFLIELGLSKQKKDVIDEEKLLKLCRWLYATIPPINDMLFDLFVDFMQKIIKSNKLSKDLQKTFRHYLFLTVDNYSDLGFNNENFARPTFKETFATDANDPRIHTVGEVLAGYDLLEIPDEFLSTTVCLDNYVQRYKKIGKYREFLTATNLNSKIQL